MPFVPVRMSVDIPKPGRRLQKDPLKKALKHECADQDPIVRQGVQTLLDLIKAQPGGERHIQYAIGSYIAQAAQHSTARGSLRSRLTALFIFSFQKSEKTLQYS